VRIWEEGIGVYVVRGLAYGWRGGCVVQYMEGAGGADGGPLFLRCNGRKGGRKGGLTSVVLLIDRYMNNAICLAAQCYPRIAFANVLCHPFLP